MGIDDISEKLGAIQAHLEHQTRSIDELRDSTSEMKEGMIRGAARMTAIEVQQKNFQEHVAENIEPHVEKFVAVQERRIGAKITWAGIAAGITLALGWLGSVATGLLKAGASLLVAGGH